MDGGTLVSEVLRLCPDVILVDITMPILSGIDAAHQLRESASSAKIVFLTLHTEQQFIEACMAEGALGYVLKSHMNSPNSSDTSGPCRTILHLPICSNVMFKSFVVLLEYRKLNVFREKRGYRQLRSLHNRRVAL
jgi:PleD family two-component response regulator